MSLSVQIIHKLEGFLLDVAFDAGSGVTALFGPSGSGKTTIANVIAGILEPDDGRVTLQDQVLFGAKARTCLPPHKRRIGYVFQDGRLFPHMTVDGNIRFAMRFARRTGDPGEVVDLLGLRPCCCVAPGSFLAEKSNGWPWRAR